MVHRHDKSFTRFGKTVKEIKGERKEKKSYYLYLFEDVTLRAEEGERR